MSRRRARDRCTRLIAAQRGFQASARVVTTANEVLEELDGLKRCSAGA